VGRQGRTADPAVPGEVVVALALMPLLWAAVFALVLALSGLRVWDRHSWPTWRALSETRLAQVEVLAEGARRQVELVRGFFELAEHELRQGVPERARHWLDSAVEGVGRLTREMRAGLAEWAYRARALAAIRPTRVPRARQLHGFKLRGLVLGWRAADTVVVTSRERFTLRAWALGTAFGVVWSHCQRLVLPRRLQGRWRDAHDVVSNLEALARESVETYRTLEVALGSPEPNPHHDLDAG